MRSFFIASFLVASFSFAQAQKLIVSPSASITESIETIPGRDVESITYIKNNSGNTALLKWKFISASSPNSTYTFSMCDIENCYQMSNIVREVTLNNGDSTFMKFGISAHCEAGSATGSFLAWIDGDSAASAVTLNYSVTITQSQDCVSGIAENTTQKVSVSPVPMTDKLNLNFENEAARTILIFDAAGKQVVHENVTAKSPIVNTATLPSGVYILQILESNKTIATRKLAK